MDEPQADESKGFGSWSFKKSTEDLLINRIGDLVRSELERWDTNKQNVSKVVSTNQSQSIATPSIIEVHHLPCINVTTNQPSSTSSSLSSSTKSPSSPSVTSVMSPVSSVHTLRTSKRRSPTFLTTKRRSYIPDDAYAIRQVGGIRTVQSEPMMGNLYALRRFANAFSAPYGSAPPSARAVTLKPNRS